MPKRPPRQPPSDDIASPPAPGADPLFSYSSFDDIAYMPAGAGLPALTEEEVRAKFAARADRMAIERRKRRR